MKTSPLPAFELCQRREFGTNHIRHSIKVAGVEVHAQMSPYGETEIEERVRHHLAGSPPEPSSVFTVARGYNSGRRAGRPRKQPNNPKSPWHNDDTALSADE